MKESICWFDEKGLHGKKKAKIKAFNRDKLIKPLGCNLYEIMPLKGNKTTHTVYYDLFNESCTCQAFQCKGEMCSHILAIAYYKEHQKGLIQ